MIHIRYSIYIYIEMTSWGAGQSYASAPGLAKPRSQNSLASLAELRKQPGVAWHHSQGLEYCSHDFTGREKGRERESLLIIHLSMYFTYIHMYVCICIHLYLYVKMHTFVYVYIRMCVCPVYLSIWTHVYEYIYMYICIYMYACTHVDLYLYLYTLTHTYVIQKLVRWGSNPGEVQVPIPQPPFWVV